MLNRVLVPVDGSLVSEVGLKVAAQIMPEGASLTILTVIPQLALIGYGLPDVTAPVGGSQDTMTILLSEANAYVRRLAQDEAFAPNHVDTAVQVGDPAQCIIDFAQQMRADLLIMPTHGRSGLSRWVFGSVTAKVLSAAPCPILIVPKGYLEQVERDHSAAAAG